MDDDNSRRFKERHFKVAGCSHKVKEASRRVRKGKTKGGVMKKKVLKGWVTTTRQGELTSFEGEDFILFGRKKTAEHFGSINDEVAKVKVTIEPA